MQKSCRHLRDILARDRNYQGKPPMQNHATSSASLRQILCTDGCFHGGVDESCRVRHAPWLDFGLRGGAAADGALQMQFSCLAFRDSLIAKVHNWASPRLSLHDDRRAACHHGGPKQTIVFTAVFIMPPKSEDPKSTHTHTHFNASSPSCF